MKIKLDENLPLQLASLLKELGHDAHTVHDERLIGRAGRGGRPIHQPPELLQNGHGRKKIEPRPKSLSRSNATGQLVT